MEFVALTETEVRGLKFACGNFLQTWEMYQRYHDLGREAYFMGVRDRDGRVVAAGLMLAKGWRFGKKIFRVPGGWLMNYDAFLTRSTLSSLPVLTHRTTEYGLFRASDSSRSSSSKEALSDREGQLESSKRSTSLKTAATQSSHVKCDSFRCSSLPRSSSSIASSLDLENAADFSRSSSPKEASSDREGQLESSERSTSLKTAATQSASVTSEEVLKFLTEKAKEFCVQKGGIALEIAPNIMAQARDAHNNVVEGENYLNVKAELEKLGYKYLGEYEQVKWTFVKDLQDTDTEEMFKAFRTDHRQRIRRAEREGVRIRELGDDELGILKEIAAEAGARHGFKDPDLEYYRSMKKAFGEKVKFMVAELPADKVGGEKREYVPLAAAMFVNDGNEVVYLYSGSVRNLQKYGGAHLMQWAMIQEAVKSGCKKYNFYGVRPVEGDGVYNFKLGFRGRVEELLGTFILPIGMLGKIYVGRLKAHEYGDVH